MLGRSGRRSALEVSCRRCAGGQPPSAGAGEGRGASSDDAPAADAVPGSEGRKARPQPVAGCAGGFRKGMRQVPASLREAVTRAAMGDFQPADGDRHRKPQRAPEVGERHTESGCADWRKVERKLPVSAAALTVAQRLRQPLYCVIAFQRYRAVRLSCFGGRGTRTLQRPDYRAELQPSTPRRNARYGSPWRALSFLNQTPPIKISHVMLIKHN